MDYPLADSSLIERWQQLEGPPNRRGAVPTSDFHLRVRLSVPFTRAVKRAGLARVNVDLHAQVGAKASSGRPARRSCSNLEPYFKETTFYAR